MLGRVSVSSADVFVLQGFELLLCAEFVGLVGRLLVFMEAKPTSMEMRILTIL